jgi:hypothetical protein
MGTGSGNERRTGMKRYVTGAIAALAAPAAAGAMFFATSGTAAASTTQIVTTAAVIKAAPPAGLSCSAYMSNSRPKDHTTTYVNVNTVKGAQVTTVAHFRTGNQEQTTTANARGTAKVGYAIGNATPGEQVNVTVTVTSGRSHSSCSTSFTAQR